MFRAREAAVRTFLAAFGTALLVPVLAFAGLLLWSYARSERSQYEAQAQVAAHTLITAVDLELSKLQVAAEALATSPFIQTGDYEAFQRQALSALQLWSRDDPNRLAVVLRDRTSQQLANTRFPYGQKLPRGASPELDQQIIRDGQPVIQGLFVGATAGRLIASVRVPVFTNGEVSHVMSIAIEPERILDLINAQKLPADSVAAVLDGSDRVIARSREHDRFVGQLTPEEFRKRTAQSARGLWRGPSLESTPTLGAYERSELSGWRAFVGMPLATIREPVRRSLLLIGALGVGSLALSYILAVPFARTIASAAQTLAFAAASMGRGEPVEPIKSGLKEMDDVSSALAAASLRLREREASLRAAEQRLRATHDNAAVGIIEVDKEGRILNVNEAECRLTGSTRKDLVGRHFAHSTRPPDLQRDCELFSRQVAGELDTYTIEKALIRADGTPVFVRVSSNAVRDPLGDFIYAVRVVEDITDRKHAEAQQTLLIAELNHRVKNTLATVQSIAFQTFKHATSSMRAHEEFEGRLISLSKTHNLLNASNWTGARLDEVLSLELQPYVTGLHRRFETTGSDVTLPASTAVPLSMVFHELATNAAKYGALSVPEGRLEISWGVNPAAPGTLLWFSWKERNGPRVTTPTHQGFGSRLILQTIKRQLNGRLELRYEPHGFECEIEIPLDIEDAATEKAA